MRQFFVPDYLPGLLVTPEVVHLKHVTSACLSRVVHHTVVALNIVVAKSLDLVFSKCLGVNQNVSVVVQPEVYDDTVLILKLHGSLLLWLDTQRFSEGNVVLGLEYSALLRLIERVFKQGSFRFGLRELWTSDLFLVVNL